VDPKAPRMIFLYATKGCALAITRINDVMTNASNIADNLMPKSIQVLFFRIEDIFPV
jgi:hypothetical protein